MAAVQSLTSAVNGIATRWRRAANASTYRQELVLGMLWMTPPQHSGGSKVLGALSLTVGRVNQVAYRLVVLLICEFDFISRHVLSLSLYVNNTPAYVVLSVVMRLSFNYIRQVNGVKLADILFSLLSVWLYVSVRAPSPVSNGLTYCLPRIVFDSCVKS